MNGVFAEECGTLLPVQRAGVSLQPADLSTAAVFMLRLVPQLSLPVVLPVFLFPNSSSHSPDPPPSLFSSPFSMLPSHSFRTWYVRCTCHRVNFLPLSLLQNMSWWTARMWCTVYICTPENTSEDTFTAALFPLATLLYKLSMHTTVCIINCEVMTAQYSSCLTSY